MSCFCHRSGNIVLLQFLVGLKQVTEDELLTDLVVNVLKASPDVLARYFKETQYSYVPRPTSAWQDNIKFLKKVRIAVCHVGSFDCVFLNRSNVPLYIFCVRSTRPNRIFPQRFRVVRLSLCLDCSP